MSSSVQYHFVSNTASNFNVCVVLHLVLAIFSSVYDSDVSASLAVMGLIAVLNYNVGLLFLYLIFAPASCIVDIVRMVSVSKHYESAPTGFFVFLRVVEILVKLVATYFGYLVYRSASEGDSGYEQISGPDQATSSTQPAAQQNTAYTPANYTAPYTAPGFPTGPVVSKASPGGA